MQRGKINHRSRARQINDFSNMQFDGGITPTDIDGLIEYDDKCFILFEIKLHDAPVPNGQKLALVRLVDNLSKPALLVIASHDVEDANMDIDVSKCVVTDYYSFGTWRDGNGRSLKSLTHYFLKRYGGERYARFTV